MRPIVVTGTSRSGKTLVRWLLSSHSRVTVSRRAELWPRFAGRFGDLSDPANLERCLHAVLERRQVAWLGPDRNRLRREFHDGPPTYARLFGLIHEQHAARTGKTRWGDQSGRFEGCVGAFLNAYPGATVVHLVRDPRDRYEALLSRHATRPGDVGRTTASWLRSVAIAKHVARAHPESYLVLRFEDLIADPEATGQRLCAAIGEPFEPAMLRMDATRRFDTLRTANECPLSSEYVGRYRDRIDLHDIAFVQSVASEEMHELGYELDDVKMTAASRLRFAASRPVNLACMGASGFPRLSVGARRS
jgi:hypothetical protein